LFATLLSCSTAIATVPAAGVFVYVSGACAIPLRVISAVTLVYMPTDAATKSVAFILAFEVPVLYLGGVKSISNFALYPPLLYSLSLNSFLVELAVPV
jgi:hypothetical protein